MGCSFFSTRLLIKLVTGSPRNPTSAWTHRFRSWAKGWSPGCVSGARRHLNMLNEWMVRYGSERTAPGSKWILEVSCLVGDGYFLNLLASLTLETKFWSDPFQNWSSNTPSPAAPPPSIQGPSLDCSHQLNVYAILCTFSHSFCLHPLGQAVFWVWEPKREKYRIVHPRRWKPDYFAGSAPWEDIIVQDSSLLPASDTPVGPPGEGGWSHWTLGPGEHWTKGHMRQGKGERARTWKGRITSAVLETTKQVLEYKA